jgi:hypothetical protein
MSRKIAVLILAVFLPALRADQITMRNGDRLTGSILKLDGKNLVFKSEYAGNVTLPWEGLASLTSSSPVYVGLDGGQLVAGTVSLRDDRLEVQSQQAGTVAAQRAAIQSLRSEAEQKAYEAEVERYRSPRIIDLWTGYVDLGLSESQGNARTSNVATAAIATRTTSRDKIGVHFTSLYASNKTTGVSIVTANALRGGIDYNLNVTPRLFAFGLTDLEFDEFQNLDLRFSPAGGLGYHAWKRDKNYLDLAAGAALNREFFSTGLNRTSGEALLGEELGYVLSTRVTTRQKLTLFPNMTRRGEYRLNFDWSTSTALWKWLAWQFTVSDRLLSNPVPGRQKNDLLFTTGFRLTFAR